MLYAACCGETELVNTEERGFYYRGCIAAMEMILDYVDSPSDEINRFCGLEAVVPVWLTLRISYATLN